MRKVSDLREATHCSEQVAQPFTGVSLIKRNMQLSLAEVLILTLLIVASVSAFLFRFRKVVHIIRAAKPEKAWSLRPLAPRLAPFIWEVLLQGKVIFDRPLPGIAHAFVFWGFCAFALVTINHLAAGLGLTLLPRDNAFGEIYFGFVAVFAALVAVSIAGLAIRRFLVRPRWLGTVSAESGVIALLIFVLMVTYLVTFWLDDRTVAARVNWWLHTVTLLAFLPLIPHTKHLHLVLSPATIFTRRDGFSQIPPL